MTVCREFQVVHSRQTGHLRWPHHRQFQPLLKRGQLPFSPRVGDVIDSDTRFVWLLSWPSIHCLINRSWSIQANTTANPGKEGLWSVKEDSWFISRLQIDVWEGYRPGALLWN